MGEKNLNDLLVSYIRDAHAMEENVLVMLDSMIGTTNDPQILDDLRQHKSATEGHELLLRQRLEAMGENVALSKDIPAMFGALIKGVVDAVRSDKPGKNARDAYMTEAMEIAAYNLLEQLADRAGDEETVRIARQIRRDEEEMRDRIDENWGKFIDLTLQEEGVAIR